MRWAVFLVLLMGCIDSNAVHCGELTCAEGAVCATVMLDGQEKEICATSNQLEGCKAPHVDGDSCSFAQQDDGTCHGGFCLVDACGNGILDKLETCDDHNTVDVRADGTPDACASNCKSTQTCGNGIVDPVNGEDCDTGDAIEHDGCSSGCRVETPRFDTLDSVNAGEFFGLAYDSDRERPVMFGGESRTNVDLQEWVHEHWQRAPTPISPSSREAVMAYDRDQHQLVLYGSSLLLSGHRDTWTRDVNGWRLREPDMVPDVSAFGLVFDAKHHRIVMIGDHRSNNTSELQTWAWDGTTGNWSLITSSAISPRAYPAIGYDEQRGVVTMFGGFGLDTMHSFNLDELWELDGDVWTQRVRPVGAEWPVKRQYGAMSYDPTVQRMVLACGDGSDSSAWEWDGTAWFQKTGAPGSSATWCAMVTDLTRKRLLFIKPALTDTDVLTVFTRGTSGVWTHQGADVQGSSAVPDSRSGVAAASDSHAGEIVVFGGWRGSGVHTLVDADTWVWRGSWTKSALATSPGKREGASMVYDPLRDEYVLFGGYDGSAYLDETWVFKAGQWTQPMPTARPVPRAYAAMAWDNRRGRVILLHGSDGSVRPSVTAALADMWSWDGAAWTKDDVSTPPVRSAPAIAYDPLANNVVLFGGADPNADTTASGTDRTWIWDGTSWTEQVLANRPPPRDGGKLAWNVARQHLELFAGSTFTQARNDLWEWDGAKWKQVAVVAAPVTARHELVSLPDGTGVAVIGGGSNDFVADYTSVRTLRWDNDDPREEACVTTDFDGDGLAGCADPDCWFDCNVECPLATTCATGPTCGDGTCDDTGARELEDCASCPADCGACS